MCYNSSQYPEERERFLPVCLCGGGLIPSP